MMKKGMETWLFLAVAALLWAPPVFAREGFGGMSKTTVELVRVRPADVYVPGKRIAVRSSGQGKGGDIERQLVASLESEILGNDPSFKLDSERPETVVEVAVLANDTSERWENRSELRMVQVGTDSDGDPQFAMREVNVRYKVVNQAFKTAFKVLDQRRGTSLVADNIVIEHEQAYEDGVGAPERSQLELSAVQQVVEDISSRLTSTSESIGVLIPKGSLKPLINLAKSGLWNRYLEAVEGMPEKSDPEAESYRQYAMGVAYEALGYAAEEPEISLSYLEQSASHYNRAIELNPSQKHFTSSFEESGFLTGLRNTASIFTGKQDEVERKEAASPIERVSSALEQYQRLIDFTDVGDRRAATASGAKGGLDGGPAADAVTNTSIIEMSRAGLPEEVILTTLETAEARTLDASPEALIALAEAKVSPKIIQRVQKLATKSP